MSAAALAASPDVSPSGVSFLIPVYNKRTYLPVVVAALQAQRGEFEREFVFVDDGSTDGSGALLAELAVHWPQARILSQPNRGPSVATNRAIAAARLQHVKLVDGDDVLLPDATARLLALLDRHPEAVLAYGLTEPYASPAQARERLAASPPTGEDGAEPVRRGPDLAALLRQTDLGPSNCLIRTSALRAAGGCDERVFVQDYSLLLRLAAQGPFVGTDAVVALTPDAAGNRINDGGPQILHDSNLTLLLFLSERKLPAALAAPAVRRALTRAWLWARRREHASLLSRWWLLRLLGWLPCASLRLALLRRSCAAFTLSAPVRRGDGA